MRSRQRLVSWLMGGALLTQGGLLSVACANGGDTESGPLGVGASSGAAGSGGAAGTGGGDGGGGGEIGGGQAIHVSPLGNDNADGKTPNTAVLSIGEGIQRALGCGSKPCEIHLMVGTYNEQVTLADGVKIVGGYGAGFVGQDAAKNPVIITSTEPKTVIADGLAAPTSLKDLTIEGADLSERSDGSSSYGIWVRASGDALSLANITVRGGKGAAGALGSPGTLTSCSALGGEGGVVDDCSSSAGSPGDADGDPVSGGEGGLDGDDNCPSACPSVGNDGVSGGSSGKDGGDGSAGLPGRISSDGLGAFNAQGEWFGALGAAGERGKHGTGGGGGGAGGTKRFVACFGCSTLRGGIGGKGGDAGCAGGGGAAGGTGGGSFAIALIDSNLNLVSGFIAGGRAGNGARGGDGADGAMGGMGIGGADGSSQKCGVIGYSSAGGAAGGDGGKGGSGGGGAGGTGGVSIGIALIGKSVVTQGEDVTIDRGTPGSGGPGGQGGNDAQPGIKGEVWGSKVFGLTAP